MIKCIVEMYGFALEVSGISEVELELEDGAHLHELISALRNEVPELEGNVIKPGENSLVERCVFNIDGRFYFENEDTELYNDTRVRLLTLATGG